VDENWKEKEAGGGGVGGGRDGLGEVRVVLKSGKVREGRWEVGGVERRGGSHLTELS